MCSRLLSMQLQFWSAWTGIINLAGGHVWVGGGWCRKKCLRLWVVGKKVGSQFASFWGVSNKERKNAVRRILLRCNSQVLLLSWKKNETYKLLNHARNTNSRMFLWQQLTQTVAGNQTQKQRPKLEVPLKFPLESVWVSSFRSKLIFWPWSVKFTPIILEMSEH